MKLTRLSFCVFLIGCSSKHIIEPVIEEVETPTNSILQAISMVDSETIWIGGHDASFIRSIDGGRNWKLFHHPTIDTLQFRDIHGFDRTKAVLMSAGLGPLSRIFTFKNDSIWEKNFVMEDSLGFLNSIDFWDDQTGIAYGDAIDEYPYILLTGDGGKTWKRAPTDNLPKAGKGEGGCAASGTCVTTGTGGLAWISTGGNDNCRVLITRDYGKSWESVSSPLVKGEVAGNTSISFIGEKGLLVGGDLMQPNEYTNNTALSEDGGVSWTLTHTPETKGAFYGGAVTEYQDQLFAFACGPNGLDYTSDMGKTWVTLDTLNYWAVSAHENVGFVAGKEGKVLKISL